MSDCVEKLPHSCGSSDALQVFKDGDEITGYCFACGTYVDDPYNGKVPRGFVVKSPKDKARDVKAVLKYPIRDVPARKLRADTFKHFGVRVAVSEQDGESPVGVFFPYGSGELTGWKFRDLENKKKMWAIGSIKDAHMFGWGRAVRSGERTVYITEGEFDAMALYQVLRDSQAHTQYADQHPAVVSLKNGAGSADKEVQAVVKELRDTFENVVLCFDMDQAGQEATEKVARIFPEAKVAHLPCKDANACLIEGASKARKSAVVFRSTRPKNTRLVYGSSLKEVACEPAIMGLSWPWEGLTRMTRGIRREETYYFGSGVKMGKSELVNTIAEHLITEHHQRVFMVKPEESMAKSYKLLVGKAAGRIFHDPYIPFDQEAWDASEPLIGDNAIFCDAYQFIDWDQLREDIRYAVVQDGVKDVLIDPITCLTNQVSVSEANEKLTAITAEISAMAKDHKFTAYLFCHLKAPDRTTEPHERGGKVFSTQFAGSRAMMRSCNYMIGMRGNKDPELPLEERNMRYLEMLEDREFGASGIVPLYWDSNTGLFNEAR